MKAILQIPGYLWAILCLLLIPVTFIKNETFAVQLAKLPFMKIHPIYSGGKENRFYLQNGLNIRINEPVYAGLRGGSSNGFVQVRFTGIQELPPIIRETIDYNVDGIPDFSVLINTLEGNTELTDLAPGVRSLAVSSKVRNDWVIRINICKN